jgi:hypothetical protein
MDLKEITWGCMKCTNVQMTTAADSQIKTQLSKKLYSFEDLDAAWKIILK